MGWLDCGLGRLAAFGLAGWTAGSITWQVLGLAGWMAGASVVGLAEDTKHLRATQSAVVSGPTGV